MLLLLIIILDKSTASQWHQIIFLQPFLNNFHNRATIKIAVITCMNGKRVI